MTNQFTNEQVERATSLADDLEGRMTRQEWLPASLGIRAAALLREFTDDLARTRVNQGFVKILSEPA